MSEPPPDPFDPSPTFHNLREGGRSAILSSSVGFFAEGLVSMLDLLAGYGLGHIDLTFHREEIRRSLLWSVMGAHSSSSQVTSNVGSTWSIIGADEIF